MSQISGTAHPDCEPGSIIAFAPLDPLMGCPKHVEVAILKTRKSSWTLTRARFQQASSVLDSQAHSEEGFREIAKVNQGAS